MEMLFPLCLRIRNFSNRLYAYARDRRIRHKIRHYTLGDEAPWGWGYSEAKTSFTAKTLQTPEALDFFLCEEKKLPGGFGKRLDERCVEWPWALSRLQDAHRILDAGSALNHPHLLALSVWRDKRLDIFTLAPEAYCAWQKGVSYLYGDLRSTPYRENEFDLIISISTLEHIGMDNSRYSGNDKDREHFTGDIFTVLEEWKRILRPGGRLLLTVPFGQYEDHGTFQQFDSRLLDLCAQRFSPQKRQEHFFLYTKAGWIKASGQECAHARFARTTFSPNGFTGNDNAAAARAVACCEWYL